MSQDSGAAKFDIHDFGFTEGAPFDLISPPPYPIGLNRSYPKEYLVRVFAAALSYQLDNKSIDYTKRRYLDAFEPEKQPAIRANIERFLEHADRFVDAFRQGHRSAAIGQQHAGLVLFDVYCIRAIDSIKAATILATYGFFGETMSVLRYFVEQAAWLTAAIVDSDPDNIRRIKAEATFSIAKQLFPKIGDLYGLFSEAAHFRPDHHGLHLKIDAAHVATLMRSARFTAYGFCATVVCASYLLNLILGAINCQYPYERAKFNEHIIKLYDSIIDYFRSAEKFKFLNRLLAASIPIDPNFAPWPVPIFEVEPQ